MQFKALRESDTESESENYTTPPVTPSRSVETPLQRKVHLQLQLQRKKEIFRMSQQSRELVATKPEEVITVMSKQLADRAQQQKEVGEPETMSIEAVLTMFKNLQSVLGEKEATTSSELINKATRSAIQRMADENAELKERVAKLELNNNKKAITISGLFLSQDKDEGRKEIDAFLSDVLGAYLEIEDFYEIGSGYPSTKVVIFQSLRDKQRIMQVKNRLKGQKNEIGKQYYINDYLSAEINEKRKHERYLIATNDEQGADDKVDIGYVDGVFQVAGTKYVRKIVAPSATQLVDMSVEQLRETMAIPICKGPEVEKKGNKFIGFSLPVSTLAEVESAYLKMRLCHPKARHIICAYAIKSEEEKFFDAHGYCDDGEHGAGIKLLQMLEENCIEQRVVFVVFVVFDPATWLNRQVVSQIILSEK